MISGENFYNLTSFPYLAIYSELSHVTYDSFDGGGSHITVLDWTREQIVLPSLFPPGIFVVLLGTWPDIVPTTLRRYSYFPSQPGTGPRSPGKCSPLQKIGK